MFRAIHNWFLKKLGVHVCEEFTQWKTMTKIVATVPMTEHGVQEFRDMLEQVDTQKIWTHRWQERTCTMCGKVGQLILK